MKSKNNEIPDELHTFGKLGASPAAIPLAFHLSSIGFAISTTFKSGLDPYDIEPRQFFMLRTVSVNDGQSQGSLAERLKVPASSMVAAVDDLERRGFIERRAHPDDRRVRSLHVTKAGQDMLDQVLPVAMEIEGKIRETLGTSNAAELGRLLNMIGPLFGVVPGAAHAASQGH